MNKNDTNNSSAMFDEFLESSIKLLRDIVNDKNNIIHSTDTEAFVNAENNITYSTDLNKFKDDCLNFINYIKQNINDNALCCIFMERQKNVITYGKYMEGIKIKKNIIEMVSNQDVKKIYELLQCEFSDSFVEGYRHTFGIGLSLRPMIGETLVMTITSDNYSDKNWFCEERYKKQQITQPKKNIK